MGFLSQFFFWGRGRGGRGANKSFTFGRQASSFLYDIAINPLAKDFPQTNGLQNFDGGKSFPNQIIKDQYHPKKKMVYLKCDNYRVKNRFETHH